MTKGYPYVLLEDPDWRELLKQVRVLLGVLTGDLGDSRSPAVSPTVCSPPSFRGVHMHRYVPVTGTNDSDLFLAHVESDRGGHERTAEAWRKARMRMWECELSDFWGNRPGRYGRIREYM